MIACPSQKTAQGKLPCILSKSRAFYFSCSASLDWAQSAMSTPSSIQAAQADSIDRVIHYHIQTKHHFNRIACWECFKVGFPVMASSVAFGPLSLCLVFLR
jgi:hypothetical protein